MNNPVYIHILLSEFSYKYNILYCIMLYYIIIKIIIRSRIILSIAIFKNLSILKFVNSIPIPCF
jgi:hypothetical protein